MSETATIEAFRAETRAWLEANCPAEMRTAVRSEEDNCWGGRNASFQSEAQRLWLRAHGRRGLDRAGMAARIRRRRARRRAEAAVLREEMARAGLPLAAVELRHLDARARRCWSSATRRRSASTCRRSRAARSAGARAIPSPTPARTWPRWPTRAEDHGDHYLVNGQKIWTSYADKADWIFCLVRTDPAREEAHGISFLLFDMATPGVTHQADHADLRQVAVLRDLLRQRAGAEKRNLVGNLNGGWDVAKYLLRTSAR